MTSGRRAASRRPGGREIPAGGRGPDMMRWVAPCLAGAAACLATLAAGMTSAGSAPSAGPGFVRVRGNMLVRDGEPWTPHGFYQIAFEVPPAVAALPTSKPFWKIAYDHYTPEEYVRMRRVGADSVRFQVAQPGMDPQNALYDPAYAGRAIGAVKAARAAGLTVILSIQDEVQTGEPVPSPLPNDATRRIWTYLAPIYGYDPGVLYELYNEPSPQPSAQNWSAWADAMNETIRTVRRAGGRNVVVADGLGAAQHLDGAPLLSDPLGQIAYAAHPYANRQADQTEPVWEAKFGAFARLAPTIVTEWLPGYFCDADTPASTVAFFDYLTRLNVGLEIGIWDFSGPYFRTVNSDFPHTTVTSFQGPTGPLACGAAGDGPGKTVETWYRTGVVPAAPL